MQRRLMTLTGLARLVRRSVRRHSRIRACRPTLLLLCLTLFSLTPADEPEYSVLMIGNSHSSVGDLPLLLRQLLESRENSGPARVTALGNWAFLAERISDNATQPALMSAPWTHVILQAQKYSTTGRYSYPTDAAEEWIRRTRAIGAQPVLFPEWARKGHPEEVTRVQTLHQGIAMREPACVAPVGIAWQMMRKNNPNVELYEPDGNHANRSGALLTAYVLFATITGRSPESLPKHNIRGVSGSQRLMLQAAAAQAISSTPPCTSSLGG